MDNHLITLRTNNFSIASLITSAYYNDENNLYHSMTSSIEPNLDFNNYSIDKTTNEYYSNSIRSDPTFTETPNGQYPPSIKKKDNRTKTNHRKTPLNKGHMEGKFWQSYSDLKFVLF